MVHSQSTTTDKPALRPVRTLMAAAFAVLAGAFFTPGAGAVTIDFATTGSAGDLGTSIFIDGGTGLRVDGSYLSGGSYLPANLYRRNQANDHGFGVCNPIESPCPGPSGGGNVNELDNAGQSELIRLKLPAGFEWVSVAVSSVDSQERGVLYSDADGIPTTTSGSIGDTIISQFVAAGPIEFSIAIPGSSSSSPYLFFEPFDWSKGGNSDNDYLVKNAVIRAIPEPATLAVFGFGLAGLGLMRRRRAVSG